MVLEQDENGDLLKRYRYNPEGVLIRQAPAVDGGGSSDAPGAPPPADNDTDSSGSTSSGPDPWLVVAALVIAGAVVAAVVWVRRRVDEPVVDARPWAEALVARIELHGRARGRPRGPSETVMARVLASDLDPPDGEAAHQLGELGALLSEAIFGGREIPADRRAWAEELVSDLERSDPASSSPAPPLPTYAPPARR